MRVSRKFSQRGSNSDNVFLADERRDDPKSTKSGPSSALQRNAIYLNGVSLAGRWWPNIECSIGSLVVLQGTSIAKTPIFFVIFQGGGGSGPPVPPPDPHMIC